MQLRRSVLRARKGRNVLADCKVPKNLATRLRRRVLRTRRALKAPGRKKQASTRREIAEGDILPVARKPV